MKNHHLTLLLATGLLAGCAPMRYSQFTGHQSWPTAPGTMAASGYALPVYRGWPDKPFIVIGSLQFADAGPMWDDGDTSRAARKAKHKGADAIIMRFGAEFGVGAITAAAADPRVLSSSQVAVLVIKWKTVAQLAAERAALKNFRSQFTSMHPNLPLNDELLEVGADHLSQLGLPLDSPVGSSKLETLLVSVLQASPDAQSSKWLFKGSVRSTALTSTYTEVTYGLATVTRNADNIIIVSDSGETSLQLSGTAHEGHLTGQLGVTSGSTIFSGKAEGVVSPDHISLTAQAQSADGLLQSSFTLLR